MCRHPTSSIVRTRILNPRGTGTGTVRVIEYIKKTSSSTFRGTYKNGTHWQISRQEIRAHPKIYRLRKILGHSNCFQLVITSNETYSELKSVQELVGPMQRSMRGIAKKAYQLANGETVTDKDLREDEDVAGFEVVEAGSVDGCPKRYLRETWSPEATENETEDEPVD